MLARRKDRVPFWGRGPEGLGVVGEGKMAARGRVVDRGGVDTGMVDAAIYNCESQTHETEGECSVTRKIRDSDPIMYRSKSTATKTDGYKQQA